MNLFERTIQKYFFRSTKVAPKQAWIQRAKSLGRLTHHNCYRKGKKLSYIQLLPAQPDQTQQLFEKVVIMAHPISKKAKYFFTDSGRAAQYLDRGYCVIALDYNGFGESDRIDLFYWRDVEACVQQVKAQFPQAQITLHGCSFGAFHVVRATQALDSGATVVLENVNKSLLDYWGKWPVTAFLIKLMSMLGMGFIREMDNLSYLKERNWDNLNFKFIACAKDDITTPSEMMDVYQSIEGRHKAFTLIASAHHLGALKADEGSFQDAIWGTEKKAEASTSENTVAYH